MKLTRPTIGVTVLTAVAIAAGAGPAAASAGPADWKKMPVVPALEGELRDSFLDDIARSREAGMRPGVFSKVGDSNTEMSPVMYGLACRRARLAGRSGLSRVIARYNRVRLTADQAFPGCAPSTSFSRRSLAVESKTPSFWSTTKIGELPKAGLWAGPAGCDPQGTPLECEIRTIRPRYTYIMAGTNDFGFDDYFGIPEGSEIDERLGAVIDTVRSIGSVPILSTLPPLDTPEGGRSAVDPINAGIARLARQRGVPLINLWRSLVRPGMAQRGMDDTGLHLSVFPGGGDSPILTADPTTLRDSVNLTPQGVRFGANRRNLIWLETLARLDKTVADAGPEGSDAHGFFLEGLFEALTPGLRQIFDGWS